MERKELAGARDFCAQKTLNLLQMVEGDAAQLVSKLDELRVLAKLHRILCDQCAAMSSEFDRLEFSVELDKNANELEFLWASDSRDSASFEAIIANLKVLAARGGAA